MAPFPTPHAAGRVQGIPELRAACFPHPPLRHLFCSLRRCLGRVPQGTPEGVENNGTITRVGTFPIGIDPERFARALETDEVQSHVAKLLNRYAGRKVRVLAGQRG